MLFNSLPYLIFFPIVFALYWSVDYLLSKLESKKSKDYTIIRNFFLVLASYVFYAWWDWRFLGLLMGMSLVSWFAGYLLANRFAKGGYNPFAQDYYMVSHID